MTLAELLREIERKGKPSAARTYRRHGVTEPTVGLSYADIGALVKRIGVNHGLALALWNTGLHEARIVATKIADPRKLTKTTLRRWMKVCGNYVVTGAVADAAANAPEALGLAREWASSPREWASTAGWTTIAILAMHAGVDEPLGDELIATIERGIHEAPNRTRYAMNSALIAIGGAMPALRPRALKAARTIGRVEVDHGDTNCKTPDACAMIGKMAAHRARKRPRAAARH